jgi:hypothetical protein
LALSRLPTFRNRPRRHSARTPKKPVRLRDAVLQRYHSERPQQSEQRDGESARIYRFFLLSQRKSLALPGFSLNRFPATKSSPWNKKQNISIGFSEALKSEAEYAGSGLYPV